VLAGRTLGEIREEDGELIFRKLAHSSKHLLRMVPGGAWALSQGLIELLDRQGVSLIRIDDADTETAFQISLPQLREIAFPRSLGGFEVQLVAPVKFWEQQPMGARR